MSKFSETLVYLRKRDGLSQQELADKIEMSRSIIGMYEAGKRMPSFEALEAIADIFNVNIDFLIGREDSSEYSQVFRERLAQLIANSDRFELDSIGLDLYQVDLIISGALPLSFDLACKLADQLGEPLDAMIESEKTNDEHDAEMRELSKIFKGLSSENRAKLLELSRLYLSAQHKDEESE